MARLSTARLLNGPTLNGSDVPGTDNLSSSPPSRCIYSVLERLRQGDDKVFTPHVVSIGLLHHGNERLKVMKVHNKRYLRDFLERSQLSVEDYPEKVKKQEQKLRSSYEEAIVFTSDQFVEMVLVDAAFITELLVKSSFRRFRNEEDCIYSKPWRVCDVLSELWILENQLSLCILDDLFDANNYFESTDKLSIISLSYLLLNFKKYDEKTKEWKEIEELFSGRERHHFVDLIRTHKLQNAISKVRRKGRLGGN
ncbi:PREDICTED: UPF0481 [Prunus dulcis]|uniref:PREDICTED: UPF0481 n=1 Tax=Prunus dulcis TaxID=3755 RepID=A0A5E4GMC5_PRUDU|nr:UPF0481 protein At3g47200-like [Prunus dulcis]VVA40890.1 PREDICTED: UPF0481 [Prunus dulcis]